MKASSLLSVILAVAADASAIARNQRHTDKTCRKTKVAVLGAGVSGITAAQALHNASITDFVIVDRNDYIGGRVKHTTFGKSKDGTPYTVELGANWVQGLQSPGGPENPIWRLAEKYGVINTFSNYSSILTYDETGYSDYSSLLDTYGDKYSTAAADAGIILAENLQDTSFRAGISLTGWKPKKNMHAQAVEWWNWDWEAGYPPEESGFVFGVAGSNVTFDLFSDANNYVWDQRGFNTFIIGEASEFLSQNDSRLMLETTVASIKHSNKTVTVDFEDGSCVEAEHVICTFSLGVLQNDVVDFDPPLPKWKREAIEQFQMGTYTKIFLQFNETFWDEDTQYFLYADADERGYYPVWQSLSAPGFLEGSNIIFVTVVYEQSYQVEQQSDDKTKAEVMAVLRDMFPHKTIPDPIDFMYPRWSEEE
jgi:polyamine oxidase